MIAVVDYGMGNLMSVEKAVAACGFDVGVTGDGDEILRADKVILPGVGAFPDAMKKIRETGLEDVIRRTVAAEKPLLGVCLGMQLFYGKSSEMGETEGLGFLRGSIELMQVKYKVPHMGWNRLDILRESPLLRDIGQGAYMYFVHSYYAAGTVAEELIATADYGISVPAVTGRGRVFGTQFHPEKSGREGLKIYRNFGEMK